MKPVYTSVEIDPQYNRKKSNCKSKFFPVYIVLRQVRKKAYIPLNIPNIPLDDFQNKNGKWVKNHSDSRSINMKIQQCVITLDKYIYYGEHDDNLTPEKVKSWFLSHSKFNLGGNETQETFSEYFQRYITKEKSNDKNYETAMNKLKAFNDGITFDKIDRVFFKDYESFLKSDSLHKVRGSTAQNYFFKTIQVFKEWCFELDIPFNERLVKDIKFEKKNKKPKYSLSKSQIDSIQGLKFEDTTNGKKREAIRDIFLFMCYTSRYYTELVTLTFEDNYFLEGPKKNLPVIKGKRNKTEEWFENPLIPGFGLEIFEKYNKEKKGIFFKDIQYKTPSSSINPVLKDISDELKLNFIITLRIARYTFKTTIAKNLTSSTITKIMGHSNINTQDFYVAKDDSFYDDFLNQMNEGN